MPKVVPIKGRRLKFVRLEVSHNQYKKWRAIFQDIATKKLYVRDFGGKHIDGEEYVDYTKDPPATDKQRAEYRRRHGKDVTKAEKEAKEHDDELYLATPGMLSMFLLLGDTHNLKKNMVQWRNKYLKGNFLNEEHQSPHLEISNELVKQ